MVSARATDDGSGPGSIKVFGIGLSRTGTTSLTAALEVLGFRAVHFPEDSVTQAEIRAFVESGASTIDLTVLRDHDAISDAPACCIYQGLDRSYPNSRFILTTRDKESWLSSIERFARNVMLPVVAANEESPYVRYVRFLGDILFRPAFEQIGLDFSAVDDDPVNLELYRKALSIAYDDYYTSVLEHFRTRPHQLLELNLTGGEGWEELAPFLDRPVPWQPFPHEMRLRDADTVPGAEDNGFGDVLNATGPVALAPAARAEQVNAYLDAFRAHDLASCLEFFADDAIVRFLDKRFRGRREIAEWHRQRFDAGVRLTDVKVAEPTGKCVDVDIKGDSKVVRSWRATFRSRVVFQTAAGKFTDLSFEGFRFLR